MSRPEIYGRGQALDGDKTTSGATLISTLTYTATSLSRGIVRMGDPTTTCPRCGREGVVAEGDPRNKWDGALCAVDGNIVSCGCPHGSNRIIAPLGALSSTNPTIQPKTLAEALKPTPKSKLKIRITRPYSEEIISNKDYALEVNGKIFSGRTDSSGNIVCDTEEKSGVATLKVYPFGSENNPWVWNIDIGKQAPSEEIKGQQSRLKNLGFYDGELDGKAGPKTQFANRCLLRSCKLPDIANLSNKELSHLKKRHDS